MRSQMILSTLFFCSLLHTQVSFGMVAYDAKCPNEFKAKVEDIFDERDPSFSIEMERVFFSDLVVLRGEALHSIRIPKNGPVKFVRGEIYQLQTRGEWLCHANN